MGEVTRVQNEFWRVRQGIDLVDRGPQRGNHIRIRRLVEPHVTVADLYKAELSRAMHLPGAHLCSQSSRLQNSAFHDAERAGARPRHAFKKSPAIDAIMVVVVLDYTTRVWVNDHVICHCCLS